MANTIKLKNSGTSSNTPSSLEHGELAINYADGKLYYKNGSNAIVEFTSSVNLAGTVYNQTIGDGTNTSYVINHNFGSRDVSVTIREASSPDTSTGATYIYYNSAWVELGGGTMSPYQATSSTRPSSPWTGQTIYETDTSRGLTYNGTAWVTTTPVSSTVLTLENTTSTSYADLSTVGPSVTLTTGTSALVTISAVCDNDTGTLGSELTYMGVAVSGASTVAASDNYSTEHRLGPNLISVSTTFLLTGLTAGSNTFTSKYRVSGSRGRFRKRTITVVGVP